MVLSEQQQTAISIRSITTELMQCIEEESRLRIRLEVAIEVKNEPLIAPTQKAVETLRLTIAALNTRLDMVTSKVVQAN
jgi:hypothetical protein